ncbi:hypothetical protein F9K82_23085 [Brucella pseudogrignonensis]|nr:hypothetical protein F9K82_23085 [Brucella pseudogrignonensis]
MSERQAPGKGSGFTHKEDDVVEILTPTLGTLRNVVTTSGKARRRDYGIRSLMRDMAKRGLI